MSIRNDAALATADAQGAAISSALRNWLETSPRIVTPLSPQSVRLHDHRRAARCRPRCGPRRPTARARRAGPESAARACAACRAAGTCRGPSATSAVRKRTVVPLLATYRSADLAGIFPPQPRDLDQLTLAILPDRQCPAAKCLDHHPRVFAVQAHRASVEVPSARAAQIKARFVRLFDPGGRIVASSGAVDGLNLDARRHNDSSLARAKLEMRNYAQATARILPRAGYGAAIFHECWSLRTYNAPSEMAGEH